MTKREKIQHTYVFIADALSLALSVFLAWLIFDVGFKRIPPSFEGSHYFEFYALLVVAFLVDFFSTRQSSNIMRRGWLDEFELSARFNLVLIAMHAVVLLVAKAPMMESRYFFIGIPLFNLFLMPVAHQLLKKYLMAPRFRKGIASLVGIMTTRDRAPEIIESLSKDWTKSLYGLALMDATAAEYGEELAGVPIKAGYEDFMDWMRRDALDEVYIDIPMSTGDSLMPYLRELESMGLTIHLKVPLLERLENEHRNNAWAPTMSSTIEHCAGAPIVTLEATKLSITDQFIKRAMDIVGSLVGCIISIPIIAVVAIPLKLESPGPLLFKQKRVGLNGRYFYIYKLRSMYVDAEERKKELMHQNEMNGLMFKISDDPRITKVGRFIRKTSIDELPQFYNVLRGDMSLVGTRPPTVDEYKQYSSYHKRRLSMKPGITGLWQVSGRSNIEDFEEVVKMDVEYIDNWSLWLDIKLLCKTLVVVFTGRGAE